MIQSSEEEHLLIFRPGDGARRVPRWQFDLHGSGRWSAVLVYPIPGLPWRHNHKEYAESMLDSFSAYRVFKEVACLPVKSPQDCLPIDALWSDANEKANAVTRDKATNTICLSFRIHIASGAETCSYAMRENSPALLNSMTYQLVIRLLAPLLNLERRGKA